MRQALHKMHGYLKRQKSDQNLYSNQVSLSDIIIVITFQVKL